MLNAPILGTMTKSRPLPLGIIIFLNDTSVPLGWTRFASADDRMIIGAGDTFSPGDSGGADVVLTASGTAGTAGSHAGTNVTGTTNPVGGTVEGGYLDDGNHAHTIGGNLSHTPERNDLLLIKYAGGVKGAIPTNGAVLAASDLGLTNILNNNYYLSSNSSISSVAASSSGSVTASSAGGHDHDYGSDLGGGSGGGTPISIPAGGDEGAHTTGFNTTSTTANLKRYLLSLWTHAAGFFPDQGMIAMWESLTPPVGWSLCQDLTDRFIQSTTPGSEGAAGDGTTTIVVSGVHSASHNHIGGTGFNSGSLVGFPHSTDSWVHNHAISDQVSTTWLPPYYALTFIQKD